MIWTMDSVVFVQWKIKRWSGYVHETCVNREMLRLAPAGNHAFIDRPDMTCPVCSKPIEVHPSA